MSDWQETADIEVAADEYEKRQAVLAEEAQEEEWAKMERALMAFC